MGRAFIHLEKLKKAGEILGDHISKPFKVFSAYETTDEHGRKGALLGHFATIGIAKLAAEKKGWYGGPGHVQESWATGSGALVYLLARPEPILVQSEYHPADPKEAARIKALNKLSPEDREALGV